MDKEYDYYLAVASDRKRAVKEEQNWESKQIYGCQPSAAKLLKGKKQTASMPRNILAVLNKKRLSVG